MVSNINDGLKPRSYDWAAVPGCLHEDENE